MISYDYEGAKKAGLSDQEIKAFLDTQPKYEKSEPGESGFTKIRKNFSNFTNNFFNPTGRPEEKKEEGVNEKLLKNINKFDYDVEGALKAGVSVKEINEFLEENQPEKSLLETAGRLGTQFGISAVENALLPYEVSVAPLASKDAQNIAYRETISDDIERLNEKKASGDWDDKDQELYDHLNKQIQDPSESEKYSQTMEIGTRGLLEKLTGKDLKPEGILEHAAGWVGYLKDPRKGANLVKDIYKFGFKPKDLYKILPGTKTLRGLGAGTAMEMAQEGNFGPAGTIMAAVAGDILGHGPRAIFETAKNPKRAIANIVNTLTMNNSKRQSTKQLIEDFNKSGLTIDAGTLTQSPLVQSMQARLAQSGLVGDALDNFRKDLSGQITREYENIMNNVGEMSFENSYQASEAIKDALRVDEVSLNIPKDHSRSGRPLNGRVSTEPQPHYQQEFLNRIAPEVESTYQAGETLKTVAEDIKNPIKEEFTRRWENFNTQIEIIPSGPQAVLAEELNNFVNKEKGSLLLGESTAEARVLSAAENLRDKLALQGGLVGVTVSDIIKTKRTMADVAKWEFGGSNYESQYKKIVGDLDRAIDRVLQNYNPELLAEFRELNAEYSQFKDVFENKNVMPLFEPKNENYNAIYNSFVSNPDNLRSLEDLFVNNPRGEQLTNQVKRDYAQHITDRPNITPRELRDLSQVLGPEYENQLAEYALQRQNAIDHPLPRITRQRELPVRPGAFQEAANPSIRGRVKETGVERANVGVRKKVYEYLAKKKPEEIMHQMDTIGGIRRLRNALELTPEGRELFKDLTRYKFAEMIDNKMKDSVTENVKLGTFSKLLESGKNKELSKELLGKEVFNKLQLLQKNSGQLAESASKFFNASKSGSTLVDMGLIGTAATGVLTGNPFLAVPALAKIGGSKILANLLSDKTFLKELERAILTNNPKNFQMYLERMKPLVREAVETSGKQQFLENQQINAE